MPDRIIDLAEKPAHVSVRSSNLAVRSPDGSEAMVPLADIAVVVASNPQITFTHAALAGVVSAGGAVVVCDHMHLPAGMLLPLQGNFVQGERIARQIAAKRPTCKRLWQQIVRCKLEGQAAVLMDLHGSDGGISKLLPAVRSGDPANIEAQAARRYWTMLFGDDEFRRDRDGEDVNRILNYGYAVLRAAVGRAVCAAGLHPSVGIHHHNRYSQFTLADDLMEPYRVVVDCAAVALRSVHGPAPPMTKEVKAELIGAVMRNFVLHGERRALFDVLARTANSLVAVFAGEANRLVLPRFPEFLECDDATE